MKILYLILITSSVILTKDCKPRSYYWRPYNGTIPRDAFDAGTDVNGEKNYVAKIVSIDKYSWTTPTTFKGKQKFINFKWNNGWENNFMQKIERFEILSSDTPQNLKWQKIFRYPNEISDECCILEGGIGFWDNHMYVNYVGRAEINGVNFIGRVYMENSWNGVHILDGDNATKITEKFEVLTYDCNNINDIDWKFGQS